MTDTPRRGRSQNYHNRNFTRPDSKRTSTRAISESGSRRPPLLMISLGLAYATRYT